MLIPKVEQRIGQYLGFLERNAYREISSLEFEVFSTEETFRKPPENALWRKVTTPCPWGKSWYCWWFRTVYRAPLGGRPLFLNVTPNADSLAFIDGKPAGAFNMFHRKIRIDADGAEHTLQVEAYSGHPHGGCGPFEGPSIVVTIGKTLPDFPNTFEGGSLLERLEIVHSLYYDVRALFELAKQLDNNSLRKARILKGLYDALGTISFSSSGDLLEKEALGAARLIAPLLGAKNGDTIPEVYLIGHAHIDHAWLWPIAETERKTARTFMNMTRFIKEYPEFIFIQSQPCQLEIVKNEYPDVFKAVQEAYKTGNWEPNGGMWVEPDCNIPSGESLIRQFLVGKGANREMFGSGYEADTLWLPDVFGYAAALPQILKGCRIKYFVTSKIGWNDTTRFPYDTFIWRGIDGSGIKTHFVSSKFSGYNGKASPEEFIKTWEEVQHKEVQSGCIRSIGEGDGGGGTLRSDIEMARRLGNLEGSPKASWKKVSDALGLIFANPDELPEWRGELYLELHRGTYTTQARTKRNNRRLEFALQSTEFLTAASALDNKADYPREELLAFWKQTLTNQFHDIIPGTCIGRVYEEAEAQSAYMLSRLETLCSGTRQNLLAGKSGLLLVNSLSWERSGPVTIPAAAIDAVTRSGKASAVVSAEGAEYPVQRYTGPDGEEQAVFTPSLPSLGWECFSVTAQGKEAASPFVYTEKTLETPFYRIAFDEAGRIISLFDRKQERELVAEEGYFNALLIAEDVPVFWDAWDIDADWTRHILPEIRLESAAVASDGAVCFRIRRTYRIGETSTLTQDMVCYAGNPRIDFETRVDWHERRRLLKVQFDTVVQAAQVRCEVQYGHIFRNTHQNLMQDRAKFEICAHKWISLEETGCGVALLNDCKYGHDVLGSRMRLSLLRSPIAPDFEADQGEHRFTYALLPFAGSFAESGVIRSSYELNVPAAAECAPPADGKPDTGGSPRQSLCSIDGSGESVIVETVKAPENAASGQKTLVFRLYESLGAHAKSRVQFSRELKSAMETDMLEENGKSLPFSGKELALAFKPFEIKTLAITFKA
ncbi:MAG: glycosyl hydrolase-related protein [Treponema sp.]|jgi:alpha-mannosidase|nr:glycosyl hydrolase-related protein [Treponema sp.]